MDLLYCAVGPFGLYLPMFAIFQNHTKYWIAPNHVLTHAYMMARGQYPAPFGSITQDARSSSVHRSLFVVELLNGSERT